METHAAPLRNADGAVVQLGITRDVTQRKLTEDLLRRRGREFRTLANSISQLVWTARPDGWIDWYNQRWYEYTGTTLEQMEGWGWQSVHDPAVLPAVLARWKAAIARGQAFEMTFPLRGADGIYRPFLTRGIPMRDRQGNVARWFGTNTDVSSEVMVQQELRKSQERLRAALAASQTGVFRWDPHTGQFLEFDDNLKTLFGIPLDQPVTSTADLLARIHPEDRAAVAEAAEASRQGADFELEHRVALPDGGVRWLHDRAKMQWENGRPAYLVGACTDITSRKADEARRRLAAIVQSSDDAIVSKDLNGIVTSWNAGAQRIFGYTPEEIVGRSISMIIPPELHSDEERILSTLRRGGRIEHFQTVRLTKHGERIDISLTVSPVYDESGRVIGAAKIARDITQQKRAERALRTSEKLASVGRLAATIAHEINNPLEAVTNLIYLARHAATSLQVSDYLAAAESELDRVSHLTKQTLGFYRESRGPSLTRVGALVSQLLDVFASKTSNKGVIIRREVGDDPEIWAISGEIRQLVANLLSNSIDAVHPGGVIRIRVFPGREWTGAGRRGVRITIADSGCGIASADRPRLFQPFFTTKKDIGTGLGLWVCKSIVAKHRGSIRVKSNATPTRSWTAFSVFLPQDQQPFDMAEADLREAV